MYISTAGKLPQFFHGMSYVNCCLEEKKTRMVSEAEAQKSRTGFRLNVVSNSSFKRKEEGKKSCTQSSGAD